MFSEFFCGCLYFVQRVVYQTRSPLRYPGGKTRACKKLEEIFSQYFDISQIKTIISPFLGGASFEFFMQNKYGISIIANDKFTPLYNFWMICKHNNETLCDMLHDHFNTGVSKQQFSAYRNCIMDTTDALQQSVYYFLINRCSFSGSTLSGGYSENSSKNRFTQSSIEGTCAEPFCIRNLQL